MKELERIEKLVRIHRQKRRKKIMAISGAAAVLLVISTTALFLTKDIWLKSKPAAGSRMESSAEIKPGPSSPAGAEPGQSSGNNGSSSDSVSDLPAEVKITVSLMGDCTLGMDEAFSFDTSLNAYYLYRGADYFFENVRSILEADDLSIVNMEGTLTESTARNGELYAFKGEPEFVDILTSGSIEAANLANNHSHDYGEESYTDTQRILNNAGITTFGYDDTSVVGVNGVQVGLVGIYELADHLERMQQLKDNIARVKAEGADLVIAVFHWGNERETIPDSNQMMLGHAAIDSGADLVVGHHSHVLQGIEKYRGKNIAYSLGNFCFGGNTAPADMDTIIYQQTFTFKDGELVEDDNTTIIPCRITSETGFNNYQPTPAEGEEGERILEKLQERSSQIDSQRL